MSRVVPIGKETKITITLATAVAIAFAGWVARDYFKPQIKHNEAQAVSDDPSRRELVNWMIDVSGKLGGLNARIHALEESNKDLKMEIRSLSFKNRNSERRGEK